jgi:plasmid stability protein
MTNMTISLDENVARWVRVWAAQHDTSVSRMVGNLLRERMQAEEGYGKAMDSFLKRKSTKLKSQGGYPTREALHER